jgi:hypothetical protein
MIQDTSPRAISGRRSASSLPPGGCLRRRQHLAPSLAVGEEPCPGLIRILTGCCLSDGSHCSGGNSLRCHITALTRTTPIRLRQSFCHPQNPPQKNLARKHAERFGSSWSSSMTAACSRPSSRRTGLVSEGEYCHATEPGILVLTPFRPDGVIATHTQ